MWAPGFAPTQGLQKEKKKIHLYMSLFRRPGLW
jgi:hypothetical protein